MAVGYALKISDSYEDPEWDAFVASNPDGHHVQTSCWARIKSSLNWQATRIIISQGQRIVGGAQILIRSIPLIGKIGYVTKGPLIAKKDPVMAEMVLDQILQILKQNHCQLMAIQPPNNGEYISKLLEQNKFCQSTLELAPRASLILDLKQGQESIFSNFHHKTRQHIRLGERSGTVVTEGSYSDLDTFYSLHLSTAQRHKFTPYKREYFNLLWKNLAPSGWITLLIARHNNEPLSALIIVPFGKTIVCKLSGWSGKNTDLRPNEAMHWAAIKWGIEHGYDLFDFEGINIEHCSLLLKGEKPALSQDGFKYGFGGKPILYPPAFDYVPNDFVNLVYRRIPPVMYGDSLVSRSLERFRKR